MKAVVSLIDSNDSFTPCLDVAVETPFLFVDERLHVDGGKFTAVVVQGYLVDGSC
jgi:hypothetical protein